MYEFPTNVDVARLVRQFLGLIDAAHNAYFFVSEAMNKTQDEFQFSSTPNPAAGCRFNLDKDKRTIGFTMQKVESILDGAYFMPAAMSFDDFKSQVKAIQDDDERRAFIQQHEQAASVCVSKWLGHPVSIMLIHDFSFSDCRRITLLTQDVNDFVVDAISTLLKYSNLTPRVTPETYTFT